MWQVFRCGLTIIGAHRSCCTFCMILRGLLLPKASRFIVWHGFQHGLAAVGVHCLVQSLHVLWRHQNINMAQNSHCNGAANRIDMLSHAASRAHNFRV